MWHAQCGDTYESSWRLAGKSVRSHPLLSEGSARHFLCSPQVITYQEVESRKKAQGNGGNSMWWYWVSSQRWMERLRYEKGVLIGVISVSGLLKRLWNSLTSFMGFENAFPPFSPFPSGYFSQPFPGNYVTQEFKHRASGRLCPWLCAESVQRSHSHCKDDWHFFFPPSL